MNNQVEIQLRFIQCQLELLKLSQIEAEGKEYKAPWLKNAGKVIRDASGRFYSKNKFGVEEGLTKYNEKWVAFKELSYEPLTNAKDKIDERLSQFTQDMLTFLQLGKGTIPDLDSENSISEDSISPPDNADSFLSEKLNFEIDTESKLLEAISKVVSYHLSKEESPVTKDIVSQFLRSHELEVADIIENRETGLNAYRIRSFDRKTQYIAFAGTQEFADVISDLRIEVGRNQFEGNKLEIQKMLEDSEEESGKKATITGHSLGGALSQITAAEFPGLIERAEIFNSASISQSTVEKYLNAQNPPDVVAHYDIDDFVPIGKGEATLPSKVLLYRKTEDLLPDKPFFEKKLHSHMDMLNDPRNKYEQISIDNPTLKERDRSSYLLNKIWHNQSYLDIGRQDRVQQTSPYNLP